MSKKVILTCGDSWTFGSEIIDPKLAKDEPKPYNLQEFINPNHKDYSSENDEYRLARIWPTYLGEMSGLEVINIAKPAISNRWILNTTIAWIMENYISVGKSTEDLMVIIGWTSIVRREFLFNIDNQIVEKTLNPNGDFKYEDDDVKEFFKWYVLTTQPDYEGAYDFININFELSNFCQKNGITCFCFNALPEEHHVYEMERYYKDLNISRYIDSFKNITTTWDRNLHNECKIKWEYVLDSSFYLKDRPLNSFANYIRMIPLNERLHGVHPSPIAHKMWAEILYSWIFKVEDVYMDNIKKHQRKPLI